MRNERDVLREYEGKGYRYLGNVIVNKAAYDAYQKSKKHESINVGNNLDLVVLHDLKAIVQYDYGD